MPWVCNVGVYFAALSAADQGKLQLTCSVSAAHSLTSRTSCKAIQGSIDWSRKAPAPRSSRNTRALPDAQVPPKPITLTAADATRDGVLFAKELLAQDIVQVRSLETLKCFFPHVHGLSHA